MKQNNEESFWTHETNNCYENNIVYNIERWFINANFFSFFFFCFFLLGFSYFIFIIYIFYELGSLGSQTHKSLTRWPASTLACITPWLQLDEMAKSSGLKNV